MNMAELVFIHGASDSAAIWGQQVAYFGNAHQVLALDLPGHGARLNQSAFDSHERNAEEVARLIWERGFSQPVLVGHSMGGAVALTVALRQPELLRGLVLAASGARMRMHPELLETARQKAEADGPQVAGSLVPLDMAVSPSASAEIRAWLAEHVGHATAQATYADFVANDRFDVMERLGDVAVPSLVIAGHDDKMTSPKFQTFLAERLPGARLELLPNAGHYVHVEQADAFNRELERFLVESDRST